MLPRPTVRPHRPRLRIMKYSSRMPRLNFTRPRITKGRRSDPASARHCHHAGHSLKAKIALSKSQVAAAETRIGEAQQAVANCIISAPFDGIVVSKDAQVGEMVSPVSAGGGFTRTGIATIVDMNSNEIEVDVTGPISPA